MQKSIYSGEQKKIANKIIIARKELNLTQKRFADILGRSQSYISKVENGQLSLDVIALKQISQCLKKKLNFFIN